VIRYVTKYGKVFEREECRSRGVVGTSWCRNEASVIFAWP